MAHGTRHSWSVHAATGLPPALRASLAGPLTGWLPAALTPLVAFGADWDRVDWSHQMAYQAGFPEESLVRARGWELTIANVYTIRHGYVDDPVGTVQGPSSGWSLGLRLGDGAGVRYDRASVPVSKYLTTDSNHRRRAISVFVNPLALARQFAR